MIYRKVLFTAILVLSVLLSGCMSGENTQKLVVEETVLYSNREEIYGLLSAEVGLVPGDIENDYNRINYCDFDINSNDVQLTGKLYYTYTQSDLPENHFGGAYPGRSVRLALNESTSEEIPAEVLKKCTRLVCRVYGIQSDNIVIDDMLSFANDIISQNISYAYKEYDDIFIFLFEDNRAEKLEITIARKDFGEYYLERLECISTSDGDEINPNLFPIHVEEVKEIVDKNEFGWTGGGYGFSDLKGGNIAGAGNTVENLYLVDGIVRGRLQHSIRFIYGEAGHCVSIGNAFDNLDEANQNTFSDRIYNYDSDEVRELFEDGCALYNDRIHRVTVADEFINDISTGNFRLYSEYGLWEKEISGVWYYVPLKEDNEIKVSNIHIMDDDFHSLITAQYTDDVWSGLCYSTEE